MLFSNPYFTTTEKIELLEKWILINCYCYYELGDTLVDDNVYYNDAKQLVEFIDKFPIDFKNSKYYNYFIDFDVSTGYYLWNTLDSDLKDRIIYSVELIRRFSNGKSR